jgi:hypothetical protein
MIIGGEGIVQQQILNICWLSDHSWFKFHLNNKRADMSFKIAGDSLLYVASGYRTDTVSYDELYSSKVDIYRFK